jgi:hypothetical protein
MKPEGPRTSTKPNNAKTPKTTTAPVWRGKANPPVPVIVSSVTDHDQFPVQMCEINVTVTVSSQGVTSEAVIAYILKATDPKREP